jgi:hypothetical protein
MTNSIEADSTLVRTQAGLPPWRMRGKVTDSSPPPELSTRDSTTPQYPPAGGMGRSLQQPPVLSRRFLGEPSTTAHKCRTPDGYRWSLTPDVIPNPLPDMDVDPLCRAGFMGGAVVPCGDGYNVR